MQDLDDVAAGERRPARQHLEQDRARREQVAARVDGLAGHLLGRHVARRAHHHAGARQLGGRAERRASSRVAGRARPKSSSFTPCGVRNTFDGLRSRWTMPRACSAASAARMPRPIGQRLGDAQRPALQPLGQRLALEQLHGDEQLAVVLADLVELADVRVVDARRGPRLAPEALARRLVAAPSDDIVLSATVRSSRSSRAAYTTPIPPSPSLRVIA